MEIAKEREGKASQVHEMDGTERQARSENQLSMGGCPARTVKEATEKQIVVDPQSDGSWSHHTHIQTAKHGSTKRRELGSPSQCIC